MHKLLCLLLFSGAATALPAQNCPFDPTVQGNELICPNDSLTLSTQNYEAYQWYTRPFGSGTTLQPVSGATGPTFTVQAFDVPLYVAVAGTQGGCTELSPEVLVDGWAFLPVTVLSEGAYEIGPNGEFQICAGDTVLFTINQPYTANIQWYKGTDSIPGATQPKLEVTQPGQYTVSGAPGVCPNFISYLGVVLEVIWGPGPNCAPSSVGNLTPVLPATVQPNPAQDVMQITVGDPAPVELVLLDARGSLALTQTFTRTLRLDVAALPQGIYFLWLSSEQGTYVRKVLLGQ